MSCLSSMIRYEGGESYYILSPYVGVAHVYGDIVEKGVGSVESVAVLL